MTGALRIDKGMQYELQNECPLKRTEGSHCEEIK